MLSFPDFKEKTVVIIFSTQGQKYTFLNDNLIVKDNDDKVILQNTCYRILALWIVGNGQISTGLLQRSKKFAFPIHVLNSNLRSVGIWNAATEGNFLLRSKQYHYQSLSIAKNLVNNKVQNQILVLKSIRNKDAACKNAIKNLVTYQEQAAECNELKSLLGVEGIAAKVYFGVWFGNYDWKGRKPRAKIDILNVLLDMGYTYLFYMVENMLNLYGFDLYKGVYHTNFYSRKSLVCDVQEPFRCIIDKQVQKAFNLGQINADDFECSQGKWSLKLTKSKHYTRLMLEALLEHKADIFLYCQAYYRAFIREKPIEQYPVFNIDKPIKIE